MPGDLAEAISQLTPSGQWIANIVIGFGVGAWGVTQFVTQHRAAKAERMAEKAAAEHDPFDAGELLAAQPVVKFFAHVEEMAVSARIIAEGVRNISAVATIAGKRWENGYEEARVWMAVDERFEELRKREDRPPRGDGRGDRRRGSGGWGGSS